MLKNVVVISKSQNWCIYTTELSEVTDHTGTWYILDPNLRGSVASRAYWSMPSALRYNRRIDPKMVFDTRQDAQAAIDSLVRDNIRLSMDEKERQIQRLHEEIEKLKVLTPKGRYRNLLAKRTPKP